MSSLLTVVITSSCCQNPRYQSASGPPAAWGVCLCFVFPTPATRQLPAPLPSPRPPGGERRVLPPVKACGLWERGSAYSPPPLGRRRGQEVVRAPRPPLCPPRWPPTSCGGRGSALPASAPTGLCSHGWRSLPRPCLGAGGPVQSAPLFTGTHCIRAL